MKNVDGEQDMSDRKFVVAGGGKPVVISKDAWNKINARVKAIEEQLAQILPQYITETPRFTSEDFYQIAGRGKVFTFRSYDGPLEHLKELNGKAVYIDDKLYQVIGVETFSTMALSYRMGFGLAVKEL